MDTIYTIEGLTTAFGSYDDANKFRKWYNKKYGDEFYLDSTDIKKHYCFESFEDAINWGIEPTSF